MADKLLGDIDEIQRMFLAGEIDVRGVIAMLCVAVGKHVDGGS